MLIGTDVPLLTSERIIEATRLLEAGRDLDTPEDARALAVDAALPPAIHAIFISAFAQSCELT